MNSIALIAVPRVATGKIGGGTIVPIIHLCFFFATQTAAFHYFLDAAQLGHTTALVEVAWYLATGSLQGAPQDADRAVT